MSRVRKRSQFDTWTAGCVAGILVIASGLG